MQKLSDLIDAGIGDTEQCYGKYFSYDHWGDKVIGCCAMGAAYRGLTGIDNYDWVTLVAVIGYDPTSLIFGESLYGATITLFDIITELNDKARWTREAIAAWLRSIGL